MNFKFNFKEFLNKITNKKYINKLLIILIVGIMLLITASLFKDNKKEETTKKDNIEKEIKESDMEDYAYVLERKLEKILSQIKGAGNVDVMITLDETTEKIPAVNKTENQEKTSEEDSQGGVREINREDSTLQVVTKGNEGSILVLKEIKPKIKGVIIVAEGAYDIEVKEQLYEAVKTVLDVSGNKVEVYSSN
ncbi:stage III sporulation protein AG [Anaerosalibacter bizertensis]|uniref:Stage III sporulation protein AG n=1 Tax=Anaerosalibacter bizertensis TaxID=932217 RepID=A0A844FFZ4_9FIRM|nr:stage III sporulation protein AG [Anaerosalibacter bizertensis]MBV1817387.1 stage III sporulation protein AG [Bacteroidales bacterium MSK.15.36]HHV26222.1 stage III sporulation protein AG [Tissierellia bacterium]MBU5293162.1 stage III sporulation protein AG [Anaerosalibacter bizertensis]MCB5558467.1 stage III sporulation protein AG [Anaerosalibacter bizertensis]MCG4564231.1 stage III sporulation protein AG [Anaerosalibacter bizertensis]